MTYRNPVYPFYFADPFVWKFQGHYYAVGTGPIRQMENPREEDFSSSEISGRQMAFPLLESPDLIHWEPLGAALEVLDCHVGGAFWAPEVAHHEGKFYLYYSVATSGLNHELRVAVSASPAGPFKDSGPLISDSASNPFTIDAHPFRDDDGQWYLFYATDFLESDHQTRPGTALMMDRLVGMTRLAGESRAVLRAKSDWQRFQANREMYGQIYDWHTLEGPCVRKHQGKYYCFYSGGCYQGAGYGVDYGVAESVLGPYSDEGNGQGARVLRTVPDKVIGPGHHSIVLGPDDMTEYIIYHAWDAAMSGRRMCIDRLDWTTTGPRCAGPTYTEQRIVQAGSNE